MVSLFCSTILDGLVSAAVIYIGLDLEEAQCLGYILTLCITSMAIQGNMRTYEKNI